MRTLQVGDKGSDVFFAQRLFNKFSLAEGFSTFLDPDGDFGNKTKNGIIEFQKWYRDRYGAYSVKPSGVIDNSTWQAMGANTGVSHKRAWIPQWDATSCWRACASSLGYDTSTIAAYHVAADGTLKDNSTAIGAYASLIGRSVQVAPRSPKAMGAAIGQKPGVLLGSCFGYTGGGHAVVVSAVWSDKNFDPDVCVVRLFNPSPIKKGRTERCDTYPNVILEGNLSYTPKFLLV